MSQDVQQRGIQFWESLHGLDEQHWLARELHGEGTIRFRGYLRLSGSWSGHLIGQGGEAQLWISEGAKVGGEIECQTVVIAGVAWDVTIRAEEVRVLRGAKIKGRIESKIVSMEEGAQFNGVSAPFTAR